VDELSEDARKLIDTAMGKDDAPPPDASWGAFVVHLTSTQARSAEVPVATPQQAKPRWWPALVGIVVIAGVLGWWLARDRRAADVAPAPSAAKAPAQRPVIDDMAPPPPRRPETPREPSNTAGSDRLLPDAEAALAAGKPDRALGLLEQHAERAPLTDADQRMALRVRVLCALDRKTDARAEARAFLDTHPTSKWSDDVRKSCAGE